MEATNIPPETDPYEGYGSMAGPPDTEETTEEVPYGPYQPTAKATPTPGGMEGVPQDVGTEDAPPDLSLVPPQKVDTQINTSAEQATEQQRDNIRTLLKQHPAEPEEPQSARAA